MRPPREVAAVWALLAAHLAAVLATYSRLPASQLYHVSGSDGLSRALVELNFPGGLLALAVLAALAGRVPRLPALAAALACAVFAVPGVVRESDLDARWVNAVPALGVGLAFALSLRAAAPARNARGDRLRLGLAALLTLVAVPWIAADLGFFLDGVPLLGRLFQTGRIVSFHDAPHHAVHHGVHHGLQGLLLVLAALLLSRLVAGRRALPLALVLAYGAANMANDGWLEQVVERGWSATSLPSVLSFGANWLWLAVLAGTTAVWLLWFRQPRRTTPSAASPSISSGA